MSRSLVLAVTCAALLCAGTSQALAQSEPNDTAATANGPLTSDTTYSAALETSNDQDWYVLYVDDTRQLHITLSNTSAKAKSCCSSNGVSLDLIGSDGSGGLQNAYVRAGDPDDSIDYTVTRGRYYIKVTGGASDTLTYTFTVAAPGGLVSPECLSAQDDVARYTKELATDKKRLSKTHSRVKRTRIARTIRTVTGALTAAKQKQSTACPA